jgi:hypothetical protein
MLAAQYLCAERVPSKFGRSGPASSRPGMGECLAKAPAALRYGRGLPPFHCRNLGDVPVRRLQAGQDTLA